MADNTAELSSYPGKKFQVSWKGNTIIFHGPSAQGRNTFFMDPYFRRIAGDKTIPGGEYYTANGCATVLKYTADYWCGLQIFPIIEKFH